MISISFLKNQRAKPDPECDRHVRNQPLREKFSIQLFLLFGIIAFVFSACDDKENSTTAAAPFDPGKPVTFTSFSPGLGKIKERVVIKGANFGNDRSKVQVFFADDVADRKATIIGVAGEAIYCIAPRQNPGVNKIKVVINGGDTIKNAGTFTYRVTEAVTTLARNITNGTDEGKLSSVNFDYCDGIGYVGNESVIVFDDARSRVRYMSVPDNAVINLQSGFRGGKPAVTKDLSTVYAVGKFEPHTIYRYSKATGWGPSRIGELGKLSTAAENYVGSLALTDDEQWLYFCSTKGVFGRFRIQDQKLEIIQNNMNIPISYDNMMSGGYNNYERLSVLIYHPIQKCFYLSIPSAFSIYKIDLNGNATSFAGSPNSSAVTDGYLSECAFAMPHGMTVDADGNIYVTDGSRARGQSIRKISIHSGYVSTVAGQKINSLPAETSLVDGLTPAEAIFRLPRDIAFDGGGAFYIVDGWGRRLRKYAIE